MPRLRSSEYEGGPSSRGGDSVSIDQQLIEAYQASGEVRHINDLFARHIVRIRTLMHHMLLNAADADDVTQMAFIRAAKAMGGFKAESHFSTWLYRIAMNCAKTFLNTKKNRREELGADLPPDPPCPVADHPDRACVQSELETQVQAALQALSPKLRAAIVLTTFHNLGVGEAARVEACMVPTMYWRIHEARCQLKELLAEYRFTGRDVKNV